MSASPTPGTGASGIADLLVGGERSTLTVDGQALSLPFGAAALARQLSGDPPLPEELTNAIGLVADHLDDVVREMPGLKAAPTMRLGGLTIDAIAAVELGRADIPESLELTRGAAEDVFRTLATEAVADRRRNPGLSPDLAHDVLGGCCILVAVMRSLHLGTVEVVTRRDEESVGPVS